MPLKAYSLHILSENVPVFSYLTWLSLIRVLCWQLGPRVDRPSLFLVELRQRMHSHINGFIQNLSIDVGGQFSCSVSNDIMVESLCG
jgi:hypothetical protein